MKDMFAISLQRINAIDIIAHDTFKTIIKHHDSIMANPLGDLSNKVSKHLSKNAKHLKQFAASSNQPSLSKNDKTVSASSKNAGEPRLQVVFSMASS